MNYLFLIALLAILNIASAAVTANDDGVLVLTDANFDEAIAENDKILVEFYAPWCGHCKQLAPEYAKAAKALEGENCALAMVDATENKEVSQKFGIQGFPTLKFFNAGKPSDYSGGRTSSDIVNYMKKKSGPPAKTLDTKESLKEFTEGNEVFVLGYFTKPDSDAAKTFLAAASGDDENVYAITHTDSIKNELKLSTDTVVIIKSFDEGRNDLTVDSTTDKMAIESFVNSNSIPLINVYSREKAKKIFSSPIKIHGLFFTDSDSDHHAPTTATFTEVASAYKGEVLFVNIPGSEKGILDYFGLKSEELPKFILADMSKGGGMQKFPFTGDLSTNAVSDFVKSFHDGDLKPTLKSEEPSDEDTAEPVIVLKGKTFKEHVIDNTKDVLVEFYAPWCGHCKKLAPIYDELGAKFENNDNVVIAKMDATANEIDVDGVNVSGFPTLYFFKGSDKTKPMKYEGGRDLESLTNYIESNAHNDVSGDEL